MSGNFRPTFHVEDPTQPRGLRKQRASKPKVRSGCRTCKKRRVKCDETKPECKRCLLFGVACDGYEIDDDSELLMKRSKPNRPNWKKLPALILDHLPEATIFNNEREYQYFLHFRKHVIPCNVVHRAMWERVVLQACAFEPTIRQLALCLSAMSRACMVNPYVNMYKMIMFPNGPDFNDDGREHLQFAINQYSKAIRGLRDVVEERPEWESMRIALIASVMIFCVEVHGESPDLAVSHMRSAFKMLRKRYSNAIRSYSHLQYKSPLPGLEYDLVATLIRLDTSIVAFAAQIENVRDKQEIILDFSYQGEKYNVPEVFTDLDNARKYFDHIEARTIKTNPRDLVEPLTEVEDEKIVPFLPSPSIYDKKYADLRRWNEAFEPLWTNIDPEEFLPAAYLKIEALATDMIFQAVHLRETASRDRRVEANAREIIDLGRWIVGDPRFSKKFSFDLAVLPSLSAVFFACRDIGIRKEAVEILRDTMPRRESVWDSVKIVAVCEKVLEVEDNGIGRASKQWEGGRPLYGLDDIQNLSARISAVDYVMRAQ